MKNNKDKQKQNKPENQPQGVVGIMERAKRRWIILLLVVVAITVSALLAATRKANPSSSNTGTFTVRRDNLTITVTEGGSIRAHQSIQYKCQVERRGGGEVTILSVVPAGTYVTQEDVDNGMVLAQLDSSALKERLVQEEMELASVLESVTSSQETRDIQLIQNESDIADGELRVRFALLDLQKYLGADIANRLIKDVNEVLNIKRSNESNSSNITINDVNGVLNLTTSDVGNLNDKPMKDVNETLRLTELITPFIEEVKNDPNLLSGSAAGEEWKRLQDNIVMAEGNLKTAEDTLIGTRKLHDANYVSDLDLQRDELTVTNRKFSRESTEVALKLFLDYDLPKSAEQYLSNFVEAGRRLQRTYAQCRSRLSQAQVRLSTAQQRFNRQEEQVKELIQQIEYCTIKAKAPGLVVYGTGDTGDFFRAMRGRGGGMSSGIIAEGEVVSEGQAIISMPDTASMVAEISVHETEVDKVKAGHPATIVMDAFPDRVLQGEVLEVAPLPDQQRGWMNPDLKVYKTLVSIDGTHDFLRSRMSCKVQILVEQLVDAIVVPIQVVSNRGGRKVCYVMTSQNPTERVVRTGVFNDTFVQIVEGLEAGEEVLLSPLLLYSESTGPAAFQQQQPLPQRRTTQVTTDVNDTETQSRPAGQAQIRAGRFGEGDTQGTRSERQFQLTDERIERIMSGLAKADPEKAKKLEQLRKSDPEKFKAELTASMRSMRQGGRRGTREGTRQADDESR